MSTRTLTSSIFILIIGLSILGYAIFARGALHPTPRTLNLAEYGIALALPGSLADITYVAHDEHEKGPGIVLHVLTGTGCDLGALYEIKKNSIAQSKTTWTAVTLKQFQAEQGANPAQVKEFTDLYLVFEPNPTRCATDEKEKTKEAKKQRDFWFTLASAHYM